MCSPPLLLLPGTLCDRRVFDPLIAELEAGASLARSMQVVDVGAACTIGGLAASVLAQAPPRFMLCGLSQGGMVAVEVCRLAPQRVVGLVLLSTNPLAEAPTRGAQRMRQLERAEAGDLEGVVREELLPAYFSHQPAATPRLEQVVIDMATALGPEVFRRQVTALRARPDLRATLGVLNMPVLWLAGQADALVPVSVQRSAARLLPDGHFRVLSGCGHLCPLEMPHRVAAEIVAWWPQLVEVA